MSKNSIELTPVVFSQAELVAQGYPTDVAANHPSNVDYIPTSPNTFTTDELLDQNYPLAAAQNHPSNPTAQPKQYSSRALLRQGYHPAIVPYLPNNKERVSRVDEPTPEEMKRVAQIALSEPGKTEKRTGIVVTVGHDGTYMTEEEVADLKAARALRHRDYHKD